ncbi:MAG: tRNA threonylcarbamoyladenosine dehydratase [Clostridia bacterium]|nr:tRNA threonylcarbamoyladenosine dehydratase [Clostridia bacterium]MBQ4341357.1 tRNA threonylcarbamoyladenosine dehydratase [Clostridia bacterium]MBR6429321.1 tRNA threonylcarbamoyladenosine dehydratase [Clostridia bacterium]
MKESFYRTGMLLGEGAEETLQNAHAAVFGVGGVGGHACDALARCGVGRITAVDAALVKGSNLNRQMVAEKATVGMPKAEAMKRHIEAVSDCRVTAVREFVTAENAAALIPRGADIVIDAVDNVTAKLALITAAQAMGITVLSSMGAGNRLDPTAVRIGDIYRTETDPLARVMRRELRARGVKKLTVCWSTEEPKPILFEAPDPEARRQTPGSVPFVPAAFGLALAAEAVRLLLENNKRTGG